MHTITRGEGVRKNSDAQSRSIDHTSLLHFRLRKIELWRKIFPSREEGKIGLFPPSLCLSLYLILFFFFDLFSIYLTISLLAIFILYHGLEEGRRYFWNGKFDGDIYNGKDLFPNAVDIIRDLFSLVIILSREDLYHYVMQNVYDYNFKEKERECLIGKSN